MLREAKDNEARTVDVRAHRVRRDLSLVGNRVLQRCRRGIQRRVESEWFHLQKCLENPKVRHDGTDDRDPNFDVYQDIQRHAAECDGFRR